ncbi:MAG: helix-turn-helix domain-containing protein [Nitrospira sp. SB0672_bin_25]|nr:helix-turn-helix domain-containing protein [Nitrospira sp. SB0672_bin_25]
MPVSRLQRRVTNRLRDTRTAAGLSQGDLAQRAGITRQALYAMEKDQYLPGTEVALQLAHALGTSVEDLFSLNEGQDVLQAELPADHPGVLKSTRVKLATIGNRFVAKPVMELGDVLNYTVPADALVLGAVPRRKRSVYVQLLKSQKDVESQILVAGCDPAIHLAGEHVRQQGGAASVVGWTMASLAALRALKRGDVHVAGIHLRDRRSGEYNLPFLRKYLRGQTVTVVRFATWQEGLLLKGGNPKRVRGFEDLARPDVRMVNRERGAGARLLLDHLLSRHRIPSQVVSGYGTIAPSQIGLGRWIAEGKADVGIGARAVAQLYNFDFIPLQEERYDLVIPTSYVHSHPGMRIFLDTLVTRRFQREIEALGGYDARESGKIIRQQ